MCGGEWSGDKRDAQLVWLALLNNVAYSFWVWHQRSSRGETGTRRVHHRHWASPCGATFGRGGEMSKLENQNLLAANGDSNCYHGSRYTANFGAQAAQQALKRKIIQCQ
ncbi:hypothetical protein FB451DRAFT_1196746 [Mycena latifolia]|nr:hypothetical protein FB451DRAFT_1196746 [Mycena latifolia]